MRAIARHNAFEGNPARTVQRILGVSFPAARAALEELADAGVLSRKSVERGTTGYVARDVLDLVDCFR